MTVHAPWHSTVQPVAVLQFIVPIGGSTALHVAPVLHPIIRSLLAEWMVQSAFITHTMVPVPEAVKLQEALLQDIVQLDVQTPEQIPAVHE